MATCLVSFLGSLQLGPVNLFVINSALNETKRTAYLVALGGCIPEFIYCALAVFANNYLMEYESVIYILKIAFIIILVLVGIIFYFKKPSTIELKKEVNSNKHPLKQVLKGFSLAALNPQLLPFWIFMQIYFNSIPILAIESKLQKCSYILGSGVGAFLLLIFLIHIVIKHRDKMARYLTNKYYFKAISLLFFTLAGYQIWLMNNS